LPAMWTINRIAFVYLDLARTIAQASQPPDDYLEAYRGWIARLDAGDSAGAEALLGGYLERHDRRLLTMMGLHP
jgi:hypothetical protein